MVFVHRKVIHNYQNIHYFWYISALLHEIHTLAKTILYWEMCEEVLLGPISHYSWFHTMGKSTLFICVNIFLKVFVLRHLLLWGWKYKDSGLRSIPICFKHANASLSAPQLLVSLKWEDYVYCADSYQVWRQTVGSSCHPVSIQSVEWLYWSL